MRASSFAVSGSGRSSSSFCSLAHSCSSNSFLKTWAGFPEARSSVFYRIAATLVSSTYHSVRTRYIWRESHRLSLSRSVGGGRFFFLSSVARKQWFHSRLLTFSILIRNSATAACFLDSRVVVTDLRIAIDSSRLTLSSFRGSIPYPRARNVLNMAVPTSSAVHLLLGLRLLSAIFRVNISHSFFINCVALPVSSLSLVLCSFSLKERWNTATGLSFLLTEVAVCG